MLFPHTYIVWDVDSFFIIFFVHSPVLFVFSQLFIFPFLHSGVEVQRGVEFCHSTHNAFRIRHKVGKGECLKTRFPLPTLLCAGYSVKLIWFDFNIKFLLYIIFFMIWVSGFIFRLLIKYVARSYNTYKV